MMATRNSGIRWRQEGERLFYGDGRHDYGEVRPIRGTDELLATTAVKAKVVRSIRQAKDFVETFSKLNADRGES